MQLPAYLTCLIALPTKTSIAFRTDVYARHKFKRDWRSGQ